MPDSSPLPSAAVRSRGAGAWRRRVDRGSRLVAALIVVVAAGAPVRNATAAPPGPTAAVEPSIPALDQRTGTVRGYLMNEFGDVDGIVANGDDVVRFPPHMGPDLVAALKPGDAFVAEGRRLPGGSFQAYSLGRPGGTALVESRPTLGSGAVAPRDVRRALTPISVAGRVVAIVRGPGGQADGIVVDDGTSIRLPPRSAVAHSNDLHVGVAVRAVGLGTRNRYGQGVRAEQFALDGEPMTSLQPEGPKLPPRPAPSPLPPS